MKKEYIKEDVAVVWLPDLCVCSTICYTGQPNVFRPKERPWIRTEFASKKEIIAQVAKCPTGALSIKKLTKE